MPHNKNPIDRGTVVDGSVPTSSGVRSLDQQASESLNGDEGGIWAPSAPIIIGGSGVSIDDYGEFGVVTTGKNAVGLVLGDNDFPMLTTSRSRTILVPIRDTFTRVESPIGAGSGISSYDEGNPGVTQSLTSGLGQRLVVPLPSYRLVNGATIDSVMLTFKIGTKPVTLPTQFLGFRVVRIPLSGIYTNTATNDLFAMQPWTASTDFRPNGTFVKVTGAYNTWVFRLVFGNLPYLTGSPTQPAQFTVGTSIGLNISDGNVVWQAEADLGAGFIMMPRGNMVWNPSTAGFGTAQDQYWFFGRAQTLTMFPNQNNTIDTATYNYAVEIIDPTSTLNSFTSLKLTMSGVTDMRPVFG